MAQKGKTYPCFGYELTIKDAADIACVSPAAFRQQLSKLGGSMETVLNYYDKRDGGVIARMENMMDYRKEQEATDAIMDVLSKSVQPTLAPAETEKQEDVVPLADNAGVMVVPAEQAPQAEALPSATNPAVQEIAHAESTDQAHADEAADKPGKAALMVFNQAIKAIGNVRPEMMDDTSLYEILQTSKEELVAMRRRVFDHLVDWDAIAKGGIAK